jgi:hypothetical protein
LKLPHLGKPGWGETKGSVTLQFTSGTNTAANASAYQVTGESKSPAMTIAYEG